MKYIFTTKLRHIIYFLLQLKVCASEWKQITLNLIFLGFACAGSKLQPVFLVRKQIAVLRKLMEVNLHTANHLLMPPSAAPGDRQQWEDFCF